MTDQTADQVQADHDIAAAEAHRAAADQAAMIDADEATVETAKAKLRAFEDETFGADAPRINGEVERGIGSPYARMTAAQKAHHAALEHLVKAEQAMADASAALAAAQAKHEAAAKLSADAERMLDVPPAGD